MIDKPVGRLRLEDNQIDAAVVGGGGLVAVLDGIEIALGENLELVGGNADGGQVLFGGVGAAVTEAEIVFGGAFPVAVALEQKAGGGIGVEISFGGVELGTLGGFDAGLVEVEVNGLGLERDAVLAVDGVGVAGFEAGNTALAEASDGVARKGVVRAD